MTKHIHVTGVGPQGIAKVPRCIEMPLASIPLLTTSPDKTIYLPRH